jgi:hypothetical protein
MVIRAYYTKFVITIPLQYILKMKIPIKIFNFIGDLQIFVKYNFSLNSKDLT